MLSNDQYEAQAKTHLEECLLRHLSRVGEELASGPGDFDGSQITSGSKKVEVLKGEREVLVAMAQKHTKNKFILGRVCVLLRKRAVQRGFLAQLKSLSDSQRKLRLVATVHRAEKKKRLQRAFIDQLRGPVSLRKQATALLNQKEEIERKASLKAHGFSGMIQQLEKILERRVMELAAKSAQLGAVRERYGELGGAKENAGQI